MLLLPALSLGLALCQSPMGNWETVSPSWTGPANGVTFANEQHLHLIPDINGDGMPEVLIGGPRMDALGGGFQLRSIVDGGLLLEGFGTAPNQGFGASLASTTDQDGDGLDDLLVGAPFEDFQGGLGVVHLISSASGFTIRRYEGLPGDSAFGSFVVNLGDISGDGFDDLAIAMTNSSRFPFADGGVVAISGADSTEIYQIQNLNVSEGLGGGVGDVNLDGVRDFLHGGSEGTYLHSGFDGAVIRFHQAPRNNEGFATFNAVADLGDINGDGVPEYAVGASLGFVRRTVGHVYVYDGASGQMTLELAGVHLDSEFGRSVSSAGDVDGDGYPDIIVGAPEERGIPTVNEPGAARIFSGHDGTLIKVLRGKQDIALNVGTGVLGVGDIDGNGLDDVLVGSLTSAGGGIGNGVWRTYGLQSYLNISPQAISASAGRMLTFALDFPDAMANQDYMILASNDAPGRTGFYSVQIPLARNPFLNRMVLAPPAWISGANGTLDAFGDATATANLTPGLAAPFANRIIRFSAVTFASPLDASNYSAGMRVRIEN